MCPWSSIRALQWCISSCCGERKLYGQNFILILCRILYPKIDHRERKNESSSQQCPCRKKNIEVPSTKSVYSFLTASLHSRSPSTICSPYTSSTSRLNRFVCNSKTCHRVWLPYIRNITDRSRWNAQVLQGHWTMLRLTSIRRFATWNRGNRKRYRKQF